MLLGRDRGGHGCTPQVPHGATPHPPNARRTATTLELKTGDSSAARTIPSQPVPSSPCRRSRPRAAPRYLDAANPPETYEWHQALERVPRGRTISPAARSKMRERRGLAPLLCAPARRQHWASPVWRMQGRSVRFLRRRDRPAWSGTHVHRSRSFTDFWRGPRQTGHCFGDRRNLLSAVVRFCGARFDSVVSARSSALVILQQFLGPFHFER
jgi:hypothetical protein